MKQNKNATLIGNIDKMHIIRKIDKINNISKMHKMKVVVISPYY